MFSRNMGVTLGPNACSKAPVKYCEPLDGFGPTRRRCEQIQHPSSPTEFWCRGPGRETV